jgi:cell division septum initiation protein DivIVA
MLWQSVVKGGVENRDLRHVRAEEFAGGANAFETCRIVERGEVDALLDVLQHLLVNLYRFGEAFAAMNDAMADRLDVY